MSTLDTDLILTEILTKLPFKSITRFKCVSKSFKSKLSSQYFIKLYHRHHSLSSAANDLLILPNHRKTLCYDLNSTPLNSVSSFDWNDCSVSVVGSFNGLLCIYGSDHNNLSILNPTTRISMKINIWPHRQNYYYFGFAFDYVNFDHKVVVLDGFTRSAFRPDEMLITMVYSMNSNSWIYAKSSVSEDVMRGGGDGVLINGHLLHWFLINRYTKEERIGCFDVCAMQWVDDVLLPSFYYETDNENKFVYDGFGVFDDRLFILFENCVDSCFDVWVMAEYRDQDSWFKLFSIPVSDDLKGGVVPVACLNGSDEILIRHCRKSRLLWFNHKNGALRDVELNGVKLDFSNFAVYTCSRSLVDIPLGEPIGNVSVELS